MARKMKAPLPMKNGVYARNMNEFRGAFDYKLVLGYLDDGRLNKWLVERGYEAEAEKLNNLVIHNPKDICAILGVPYNTTYEDYNSQEVVDEHNKKQLLKGYTNDEALLAKSKSAAFNQTDLDNLVMNGEKKILLVSKKFRIPLDVQGLTYICVSNPVVYVNSNEWVDFENLKISFEGDYQFDEAYQKILAQYKENIPPIDLETLNARINNALANSDYDEVKRLNELKKQLSTNMQDNETAIEPEHEYEQEEAIIPVEVSPVSLMQDDVDYSTADDEIVKKAAEQGIVKAQIELSDRYYDKKNYDLTFEWSKISAESGDPEAQWRLAICYECGIGTAKEPKEAFSWAKKAAEQGYMAAQHSLGIYYQNGYGEQKNANLAFKWLSKAAEQGHYDAMYLLASNELYENKVASETRLNMLEELADNNYENAVVDLGFWYLYGYCVSENYKKAKKLFNKAIEQWDNSEARFGLGVMIFNGHGQDKNEEYGVKMITDAAMHSQSPSISACEWLRDYYDEDQGFSVQNMAKGAAAGAVAGMGIFSIAGSIAGGIGYGFLGDNKRDAKKAEFFKKRAEKLQANNNY